MYRPGDLEAFPLPSVSVDEIVAHGESIMPALIAALHSDATVLEIDERAHSFYDMGFMDLHYARYVAAQALGRLGAAAAIAVPDLIATWPRFIDKSICVDALFALGPFCSPDVAMTMLTFLAESADAKIRLLAADWASSYGQAGRLILERLAAFDADVDVRRLAKKGLAVRAPKLI